MANEETETKESETRGDSSCRRFLSPLQLSLLVVNAICLGACIALLVTHPGDGVVVLLTIGVGLSTFAGLVGAILAWRRHCRGK